jgi:hypothetical protein
MVVGDHVVVFLLIGFALAAILFVVRTFFRPIYGLGEIVIGLVLLYARSRWCNE